MQVCNSDTIYAIFFFHFIVLEVHWQLGLLVSSSAVTSYHTYKGDKADMSKKLSDKDVFKVPIEFSKKYHLTALKFRYNMYLCTGNFWHASHMSPAQVCLVVCHTFGSALFFCNHFTSPSQHYITFILTHPPKKMFTHLYTHEKQDIIGVQRWYS